MSGAKPDSPDPPATSRHLRPTSNAKRRKPTSGESCLIPIASRISYLEHPRLQEMPYYHGFMPRSECEKLFENPAFRCNGVFLVRQSVHERKYIYVISSWFDGALYHTQICCSDKFRYWVTDWSFQSIPALIEYHVDKGDPVCTEGYYIRYHAKKSSWQLDHSQIMCTRQLGAGNFGCVYEALYQYDPYKKPPNVVAFYGVATTDEPMLLVMELVGASLQGKIEKEEQTEIVRLNWIYDAAKGMQCLEEHGVLHRDVAARNFLLDREGVHVKVSDFGLSMARGAKVDPKKNALPLRYWPPEVLKSYSKAQPHFDHKADVWSFGVMVTELYTRGKRPFEILEDKNPDVRFQALIKKTKKDCWKNYPLLIPMRGDLEKIVHRCFEYDPKDRPTFAELVQLLAELPDVVVHVLEKPKSLRRRIIDWFLESDP
ncbi:unnamed protein product, partial [Mesorhabditis spiculigera]